MVQLLGDQALKEMHARAADSEAVAARLHKEKRKAALMAEVWTHNTLCRRWDLYGEVWEILISENVHES